MKHISVAQYNLIKDIPRSRMTARFMVYVGAIIVENESILLCKTKNSKYPGWQLPGGRALWSESFTECIKREVLEETGISIKLKSVIGIFQRKTTVEEEEFIRIIFSVNSYSIKHQKPMDENIEKRKWFKISEIIAGKVPLQSDQILEEVKNIQAGTAFPLDVIKMYKW